MQIWEGITFDGKPACTYAEIEAIRAENLRKARTGEAITKFCPQKGFQEEVCTCDADITVIGGKRGGGKSAVMNMLACYGYSNPQFGMFGFRREKGDLERGLWASSKQFFTKVAQGTVDMTWKFKTGSAITYEHLADESKVDQRFRGVEMPYICADEFTQMTENTFFSLLASNRNTIGIRNRMVASCNPVGEKHWVHRMLKWYINEETHTIIPERSGVVRYFYKYGKSIDEIIWGNSKKEVYRKAKNRIDQLVDFEHGESYENLIASFCFIEGNYSDNQIFKALDPSYKGKLSQQGGEQSVKDILGIWVDAEEGNSLLTSSDVDKMFTNTPQTTGKRCCTADVALSGDFFVLDYWEGRHLVDFKAFTGVLSDAAVDICQNFLEQNSLREENFLYDENGLGLYLKGYFKKAHGFNNKQAASNTKLWNNQKSECAENFVNKVKQGKYSINPELRDRVFNVKKGITFYEELVIELPALRRRDTETGRFELIQKPEAKKLIGHSPDLIESIFEREGIVDAAGIKRNLGMFNFI